MRLTPDPNREALSAPALENPGPQQSGGAPGRPRSLPVADWPVADRSGWLEAFRPPQRIKRGGAASHLASVSQADIANRYGLFLDFLQRHGQLDLAARATTFVTPDNVQAFVAELQGRVRPVTTWNSVYKLRRAAQLIAPTVDFQWLTEIEKDVAFVMISRSKSDRLVLTERLVEAGLTMIQEAELFGKTAHASAKGVRNGLLIALLALHPIRIKNFADLTIGKTFVKSDGSWWLHIPSDDTKSRRTDDRQVPRFMLEFVNRYVDTHRPFLCRDLQHQGLWVSSTTGQQMSPKNLGSLISKITHETIGVDVSPHLFRTAGASTAALHESGNPRLASALLNHRDKRVTEEHYNLSASLSASEEYAFIARSYRRP